MQTNSPLPLGLWLSLSCNSDGDLPGLMVFSADAMPVLLKRAESLVADLVSAGFSEARIPLATGWTLLSDEAEPKPEYAKAFSRHCMELASTGPNHLWFTISTGEELRTSAFTLDDLRQAARLLDGRLPDVFGLGPLKLSKYQQSLIEDARDEDSEGIISAELSSSEHGFDDFDVAGHPCVHRACVRHDIQVGDVFNVYHGESSKSGLVWDGSLLSALRKFAG